MQRDYVGAAEQFVEFHQSLAGAGRAVPGDHLHAEAAADARHLTADAAEPDDAERLASQLYTLVRHPGPGPDLAVHARHIAAGGHHQCDGVFGNGSVAVALDGMHADAALRELVDVHVAS